MILKGKVEKGYYPVCPAPQADINAMGNFYNQVQK